MGTLVAGAASGLCAAAVIALINKALHQPATGTILVWGFGVLVVVRVLSAAAAQIVGDRFSHQVYVGLCQDIGRRLLGVPMPRLEAIGMPRMLVTLTEDVSVIAWAVHSLPGLAINLAILLGCAVYLGWLSWAVFLGVAGLAIAGTITFLLLLRSAQAEWREVWLHRERLVGYLRTLIDGIKELKLNAPRRSAFLSSCLGDALEAVRRTSLRGSVRQAVAKGWSQTLFFLLVGILVFRTPSLHAGGPEILTGYLLVVIYMMTPLWNVIDSLAGDRAGQPGRGARDGGSELVQLRAASSGSAASRSRVGASCSSRASSSLTPPTMAAGPSSWVLSISRSGPARSSSWPAETAVASPPSPRSSPGYTRRTPARSGWTATSSPSRRASGTMRTSRRSFRTFTSSTACSD